MHRHPYACIGSDDQECDLACASKQIPSSQYMNICIVFKQNKYARIECYAWTMCLLALMLLPLYQNEMLGCWNQKVLMYTICDLILYFFFNAYAGQAYIFMNGYGFKIVQIQYVQNKIVIAPQYLFVVILDRMSKFL